MLKPVNLEGFVLREADLTELLPDATQEEMESVASLTTEYLMEQWYGCLEMAVAVVQNERKYK